MPRPGATAAIIRSEPMAMIRPTLRRGLAARPGPVAATIASTMLRDRAVLARGRGLLPLSTDQTTTSVDSIRRA